MSDTIPPGYERCDVCGEFNGATAAGNLTWAVAPADPEQPVGVSCLCRGVPCRTCGVHPVHRGGSNSYDAAANAIGHWPGFASGLPCPWCRALATRGEGR